MNLQNKINKAYKIDPTRTKTLRSRFTSKMMGKFDLLAMEIKRTIIDNDYFVLSPLQNNALPQSSASTSNDKKLEAFLAWLILRIDKIIFGGDGGKWMELYGRAAYESGLKAGYIELKKEKYIEPTEPEPEISKKNKRSKKYLAALLLLLLRTNEEIKGATGTMVQRITRVIIDDISAGKPASVVSKDVINQLNKAKTQAKATTQTEIVRDHDFAKLDIWVEYDVKFVGILAEWITAQDDKVCPICASNEFSVWPINELYFMLPAHPYCRCTPRVLPMAFLDGIDVENLQNCLCKHNHN